MLHTSQKNMPKGSKNSGGYDMPLIKGKIKNICSPKKELIYAIIRGSRALYKRRSFVASFGVGVGVICLPTYSCIFASHIYLGSLPFY